MDSNATPKLAPKPVPNAPTQPPPQPDTSTSSANPATMTFVLPSTTKDGTDHFAVTTFPNSYEDATAAASRVLEQYLTDPRPENLILRCSILDRRGNWGWADIDPLNWKLVIGLHNNEVGVFEKRVKDVVGDLWFSHGRVHITYKYMLDGQTNWNPIYCPSGNLIGLPVIDRPKNFNEAVEYVKIWLKSGSRFERREHKDKMISADESKFSFYNFDNVILRQGQAMELNTWTKFPPMAYGDPQLWREIVPKPGGVLGVAIDQN